MLQAFGLTTFGQSLRTAFDLLNLNRLVSGIDNYGQVRFLLINGDDHDYVASVSVFTELAEILWSS